MQIRLLLNCEIKWKCYMFTWLKAIKMSNHRYNKRICVTLIELNKYTYASILPICSKKAFEKLQNAKYIYLFSSEGITLTKKSKFTRVWFPHEGVKKVLIFNNLIVI